MKSKWFEYKEEVRDLRRQGYSLTYIEKKYGIARSTLSGWFKDIPLSEKQRTRLMKNSQDGWKKARISATKWHKQQKQLRLQVAQDQALDTIEKLDMTPEVLEVALAMLYLGEGAKNDRTSIASSDPMILRFVLAVVRMSYGITRKDVYCELHLRADQDPGETKEYWSRELGIPIENFRSCFHDQRTAGRKTYEHYKGVCVLYCGGVAIQRKLINLYNLFCARVETLEKTADD